MDCLSPSTHWEAVFTLDSVLCLFTGLTHTWTDKHIHIYWHFPILSKSLECRRKPQYPEESHTVTGRTCKFILSPKPRAVYNTFYTTLPLDFIWNLQHTLYVTLDSEILDKSISDACVSIWRMMLISLSTDSNFFFKNAALFMHINAVPIHFNFHSGNSKIKHNFIYTKET